MEHSPNNTYQALALLERYLFLLKSNTFSTHEILFCHCFENYKSIVTKTTVTCERLIVIEFTHLAFEGWYFLKIVYRFVNRGTISIYIF